MYFTVLDLHVCRLNKIIQHQTQLIWQYDTKSVIKLDDKDS